MNRTTAYLLGPELVWLLILAVAGVFASLHQPLTIFGRWNLILVKLFLPSIGVLLAFVPFYWAPGNQGWLLTRIVITSLLGVGGLVYFLSKLASYDDIRDVGLIIGFVGFVFIGYTVLACVGGIATLFLIAHRPFLPVLTWILILSALVLIYLQIGWWR